MRREPTVAALRNLPDPYGDKVPSNPETAARINAAVQVGGGLLLATGKMPRIASAALAFTVIPGSLGGHLFWTESDPERKAQKRRDLLTDLSLLGGLIIAVGRYGGQAVVGMAWSGKRPAASRRRYPLRSRWTDPTTRCSIPSWPNGSPTACTSDAERGRELASTAAERSAPLVEAARKRGGELASTAAEKSAPVVKKARKKARKRGASWRRQCVNMEPNWPTPPANAAANWPTSPASVAANGPTSRANAAANSANEPTSAAASWPKRHANAAANWLTGDGSRLVIGTDRAIDGRHLAG